MFSMSQTKRAGLAACLPGPQPKSAVANLSWVTGGVVEFSNSICRLPLRMKAVPLAPRKFREEESCGLIGTA